MPNDPITPDREQQRRDNNASRRQSGLDPLPKDREEPSDPQARDRSGDESGASESGSSSDEARSDS